MSKKSLLNKAIRVAKENPSYQPKLLRILKQAKIKFRNGRPLLDYTDYNKMPRDLRDNLEIKIEDLFRSLGNTLELAEEEKSSSKSLPSGAVQIGILLTERGGDTKPPKGPKFDLLKKEVLNSLKALRTEWENDDWEGEKDSFPVKRVVDGKENKKTHLKALDQIIKNLVGIKTAGWAKQYDLSYPVYVADDVNEDLVGMFNFLSETMRKLNGVDVFEQEGSILVGWSLATIPYTFWPCRQFDKLLSGVRVDLNYLLKELSEALQLPIAKARSPKELKKEEKEFQEALIAKGIDPIKFEENRAKAFEGIPKFDIMKSDQAYRERVKKQIQTVKKILSELEKKY